jgi:hypothetical protein
MEEKEFSPIDEFDHNDISPELQKLNEIVCSMMD